MIVNDVTINNTNAIDLARFKTATDVSKKLVEADIISEEELIEQIKIYMTCGASCRDMMLQGSLLLRCHGKK